jgi:hypothetical protein
MRINIYNEELTDDVESETKIVNKVDFTAVRFIVGERVEHTPGDDDSSAVSFWFSDEYGRNRLISAFTKALAILNDPANRK